jgi:tRNA(adenine34) deaminase
MTASAADIKFMRAALALAQSAESAGEVPVGAVLVIDDAIVASAANSPIQLNDPTAHAEILAVREAGKRIGNYRLPQATLYVTLEPCPMCAAALVHARIARLVYAAADPKSGAAGSVMDLARDTRLNHRIEVDGGVLADEAATLLRNFFRARRVS